jgi:hypothetical protein
VVGTALGVDDGTLLGVAEGTLLGEPDGSTLSLFVNVQMTSAFSSSPPVIIKSSSTITELPFWSTHVTLSRMYSDGIFVSLSVMSIPAGTEIYVMALGKGAGPLTTVSP